MTELLRAFIRRRALGLCEYCQLPERLSHLSHHVDHILPRKHGGTDRRENLALACAKCSLGKGSNLASRDENTGRLTRLFHPRIDDWYDHFQWQGAMLKGKTAIGRVTVSCMNINAKPRIEIREFLITRGNSRRNRSKID